MQRDVFQGDDGFTFGRTELKQLTVNKDGCHDGAAWADLDGDGVIDLVGIETTNGHDEADHELVGLHVPSGRVVWRALTGEASREVALVNGVVVCAANERNTLRGLHPRNGAPLWQARLEDCLKNDPFDGFDGAHAIADRGHFALFECENTTAGAVEVTSGRQVLRQRGQLGCHTLAVPGLACVRDGEDFDHRSFTVMDLYQHRVVYQAPDNDVGMAWGAGKVAFFHFDPPNGTHVTVIDLASRQTVARASCFAGSESPLTNQVCDDPGAGLILENGKILKGNRYSEELHVFDVTRRQCMIQPPPRPGFVFWQMTRVGNLLYVAYKQKDGTPRLLLTVWDAATLSQYGQLEGFGGAEAPNAMLAVPSGLLVARTTLNDTTWRRNNQVAWVHLDPSTGRPITEYPVPDIGCVEVHGKFLCAMGTYYGTSFPVVYDTDTRARVL